MVIQVLGVDAAVAVLAWKGGWHLDTGCSRNGSGPQPCKSSAVVSITPYLFPAGAADDLTMADEEQTEAERRTFERPPRIR